MSSEQSKQIVCIAWNVFAKRIWANFTDMYIWKNQSLKKNRRKGLKPLSKLGTNHSLSSRHELDRSWALHIWMTQTAIYSLNHLIVSGPYGAWLHVLLVALRGRDGFVFLQFFLYWTSSFFASRSFVEVTEVVLQLWSFVTQGQGSEWWDCLHLNHQH